LARPRFLADEDLRFEIVLAVRRLEPTIDFTTMTELGRSGSTDEEVLSYAQSEGRIVVSHDVNTMKGLAEKRIAERTGVSGVLLTAQRNPTRVVAESILLIWGASDASEWSDRVAFIPI